MKINKCKICQYNTIEALELENNLTLDFCIQCRFLQRTKRTTSRDTRWNSETGKNETVLIKLAIDFLKNNCKPLKDNDHVIHIGNRCGFFDQYKIYTNSTTSISCSTYESDTILPEFSYIHHLKSRNSPKLCKIITIGDSFCYKKNPIQYLNELSYALDRDGIIAIHLETLNDTILNERKLEEEIKDYHSLKSIIKLCSLTGLEVLDYVDLIEIPVNNNNIKLSKHVIYLGFQNRWNVDKDIKNKLQEILLQEGFLDSVKFYLDYKRTQDGYYNHNLEGFEYFKLKKFGEITDE